MRRPEPGNKVFLLFHICLKSTLFLAAARRQGPCGPGLELPPSVT